jgi:hypothetical protein
VHEIFGGGRVTEQSSREGAHRDVVRPIRFAERFRIALGDGIQKRAFGEAGAGTHATDLRELEEIVHYNSIPAAKSGTSRTL